MHRESPVRVTARDRFERLRDLARRRRLRLTPQREALLRVLGRVTDHPTADELHRGVRRAIPSVSPATVYRNVQVLVRAGVIATLARAGAAAQYDANLEDHHHFICHRCGRVLDIYLRGIDYQLDAGRSRLRGARIDACEVRLSGVCARCRR